MPCLKETRNRTPLVPLNLTWYPFSITFFLPPLHPRDNYHSEFCGNNILAFLYNVTIQL